MLYFNKSVDNIIFVLRSNVEILRRNIDVCVAKMLHMTKMDSIISVSFEYEYGLREINLDIIKMYHNTSVYKAHICLELAF